ncbi:MAG TPA: hypothetical protein VFS39_00460 [Nitrospira sp.]|nr:hypothetical protein [Nitrospira sp.]
MTLSEALNQACASVGILPPKSWREGRWCKADTLSGKNGKGDGRVMVEEGRVTVHNWQTGVSRTVWLNEDPSPVERRQMAEKRREDDRKARERAAEAARIAKRLVDAAALGTHPYLARKGFPAEKALVLDAKTIREIAGEYLIAGERAIIIPARIGNTLSSAQLIFEDGTKKFLSGGRVDGTCHRIANGQTTWLCEGFASGLSLRAALKGLKRTDTILCCFSASNVATIARQAEGSLIVTDHDKPIEHFGGLGTGEHYARLSGRPYVMPPTLGQDVNDMHMSEGIFAVQKMLARFLREAR